MDSKRKQQRTHFAGLAAVILVTILMLAACDRITGEDEPVVIPTLAELNFEEYQTAIVFTQNAPPPGFDSVAFPEISDNLITTVYSRFEVTAYFEGHYSVTGEAVNDAYLRVLARNDEYNVARYIRIEFLGDVFSGGSSNLDIARFGNDYYMVDVNGICTTDSAIVGELANLRAGQLIGGIEFAQPTGRRGYINGIQSWQYGFDPQFINWPAIELDSETSELDFLTGEIWVAPEPNIVVSYTIELNVHRAKLMFGEREVTGRLRYQYNVFDIGVPLEIPKPNGC